MRFYKYVTQRSNGNQLKIILLDSPPKRIKMKPKYLIRIMPSGEVFIEASDATNITNREFVASLKEIKPLEAKIEVITSLFRAKKLNFIT